MAELLAPAAAQTKPPYVCVSDYSELQKQARTRSCRSEPVSALAARGYNKDSCREVPKLLLSDLEPRTPTIRFIWSSPKQG